jgi:NAD/NADP transhydrogenase alpha subunit
MDILSSQANLAGYRAVIEGAAAFDRGFPMLMTAAGTVPAANVFVMGAGRRGLQAIATARRLGGRVSATDVRPAAKEEIKSLGASFVGYEDEESRAAQTAGGYAKADERRLPGQAGRGGGGRDQEVRHRGLHGAGARAQGADLGFRSRWSRA